MQEDKEKKYPEEEDPDYGLPTEAIPYVGDEDNIEVTEELMPQSQVKPSDEYGLPTEAVPTSPLIEATEMLTEREEKSLEERVCLPTEILIDRSEVTQEIEGDKTAKPEKEEGIIYDTIMLFYYWNEKEQKVKLHHTYPEEIKDDLVIQNLRYSQNSFKFNGYIFDRKTYKCKNRNMKYGGLNTFAFFFELVDRETTTVLRKSDTTIYFK